jgi:hypothetical protein
MKLEHPLIIQINKELSKLSPAEKDNYDVRHRFFELLSDRETESTDELLSYMWGYDS